MAVFKQTLAFTGSLKQIRDTDSDGTAENDINGGAATLYGIRIDNTLNSSAVFLKLYNHAGPTIGTTVPDIVLKCYALKLRRVMFPEGIAFGTGISYATVTVGGTTGTGSPTNDVEVDLIIA